MFLADKLKIVHLKFEEQIQLNFQIVADCFLDVLCSEQLTAINSFN